MLNSERLSMEIKGITLTADESNVYLQENGLQPTDLYNPSDKQITIKIYETALSILESIANNPSTMKDYKQDDISVSKFHDNLLARIDGLERKIRKMKNDYDVSLNSNFFNLFSE